MEGSLSNSELKQMVKDLLLALQLQARQPSSTGLQNRGIAGITFDRYDKCVEDFNTSIEHLSALKCPRK